MALVCQVAKNKETKLLMKKTCSVTQGYPHLGHFHFKLLV